MDAAAVLWLALGVVLLALTGLLAAPALRHRPRPAGPADPAAPPPPPRAAFPDDDLPAFRLLPPGTPGELPDEGRPAPARVAPVPQLPGDPGSGPTAGRVVLAMAVAALALIAVLVGLATLDRGTDDDPVRSTGGAAPPATAETPLQPVPALPPVPASPAPGEPGAGALAAVSVPLDDGGLAARLAFAPLVLERHAVGVTVTVPTVGVTHRSDGTALAHLRLPTWNCLATEAPADPAAAGCSPAPVEYADLPSPALQTTPEDGGLRLTGRFPTYTRPAGGPPAYTGRTYAFTLTVTPRAAAGDGAWAPARGTLFLGTARTESLLDPLVSAVRRGG